MSDWKIEIMRTCPTCKGATDRPFHQWCKACSRDFAPGELRNIESTLPCGHDVDLLHEESYCVECEDTGVEYRTVTLVEFAELLQEAVNANNR